MKEKFRVNGRYRRGVILIAVLAALILLINIVTVTYSWFTPGSASGTTLQFYQENDGIRSENCSATYALRTAPDATVSSVTCPVATDGSDANDTVDSYEGLVYFKISIRNAADTPTNISLYLNQSIPAGVTIGIVSPTNSVHTYTDGAANGDFLIRNAYVSASSSEIGSGEFEVEAFLRNTGSAPFTLTTSYIQILYN